MSTKSSDTPHLRLVEPTLSEPDGLKYQENDKPRQLDLFPDDMLSPDSLLGFLHMSHVTDHAFVALVEQVRPVWLFDLRPVPWFQIERLNRATVFRLLDRHTVKYQDLAAMFRIETRLDERLMSGEIVRSLNDWIASLPSHRITGPIVFLVDDSKVLEASAQFFEQALEPSPQGGWSVRTFDPRARNHLS